LSAEGDGRWTSVAYVRAAPRDAAGAAPPTSAPDRPDVSATSRDLHPLLHSDDAPARDAAWDRFVARHSRLLLHVARRVMPDRDGAMDAYAFVLDALRRDDCRVLRGYVADGRCQFTTWLAVVARRTCVDFYRQRYGRPRGEGRARRVEIERAARQRLATLTGAPIDVTQLVAGDADGPEDRLRAAQLHDALEAAMATLPADDRLLLKLRFEDELSAQAIAGVVGMPTPFHVYRRIRAVCAALRRRLRAHGVESSAP
jgi:RNA polymerase sigma factor (sigma-70 family)